MIHGLLLFKSQYQATSFIFYQQFILELSPCTDLLYFASFLVLDTPIQTIISFKVMGADGLKKQKNSTIHFCLFHSCDYFPWERVVLFNAICRVVSSINLSSGYCRTHYCVFKIHTSKPI